MKTVEKLVKCKENSTEAKFNYSAPEDLNEAIQVDGEAKVFSLYSQERTTSFLDAGRRLLKAGKTPAEVTEFMNSFKLGDRLPASERAPVHVDVEKILAMDPEARKKAIAELQEKLKALKS